MFLEGFFIGKLLYLQYSTYDTVKRLSFKQKYYIQWKTSPSHIYKLKGKNLGYCYYLYSDKILLRELLSTSHIAIDSNRNIDTLKYIGNSKNFLQNF